MRTPPLTYSSSAQCTSSRNTPSSPTTPTQYRNQARFLHCALDSDEDDDDEEDHMLGMRIGRTKRRIPLTPTKSSRSNRQSPLSPSRFIVKGTVTPSRAAPLFTRFSKQRRAQGRQRRRSVSSDSESENLGVEQLSAATSSPSRCTSNVSTQSPSRTRQAPGDQCLSLPPDNVDSNGNRSYFITPSVRASRPPPMPVPTSIVQRHHLVTSNMASYVHALRSNTFGHLGHARSTHDCTTTGALGQGVLSASRCLGAGFSRGSFYNVSQRPFHQTFNTTSTPSSDLFTLPSQEAGRRFSHPLCAEYANCSRSLGADHAQWLAVGTSQGHVSLLNTAQQVFHASDDDASATLPSWSAHDGAIFDVKWRFDDERIATGSSDYHICVWDTATGENVASFAGHRGTPRSIAWDPHGAGNLLASGGRDGAIHVYDMRIPGVAVASMWGAHTSEPRKSARSRRQNARGLLAKGVTSLTYVPGRGANILCSAGCEDGTLKLWDLRTLANSDGVDVTMTTEAQDVGGSKTCFERSVDVSTYLRRQNKSSHGISSIVASSSKVFAACTDGCIYALSAASFLDASPSLKTGLPSVPLYDAVQRGNTLYARLALHDDERTLALGCNSGTIAVWDTHAATLAAAELASLGVDMSAYGHIGARRTANTTISHQYAQGHEALIDMAKPAILRGGHRNNFEINAISWAYDHRGPMLASASDDYTIRTWRPTNSSAHDAE